MSFTSSLMFPLVPSLSLIPVSLPFPMVIICGSPLIPVMPRQVLKAGVACTRHIERAVSHRYHTCLIASGDDPFPVVYDPVLVILDVVKAT